MDRRTGVSLYHGSLLLLIIAAGAAVPSPQCVGPPDRGERFFFLAPRVPPPQRQHKTTVTTTVTATRVISEVWLSSCVTYETTLPVCPREGRRDDQSSAVHQHFRLDPREIGEGEKRMALSPSRVEPILSTEAPHLPDYEDDDSRKNARKFKMFSKPFWEDLVGLAFPHRPVPSDRPTPPLPSAPSGHLVGRGTVTRTVSVTETTRVKGPKTVVSFSITGCLPSKLPFELELCDKKEPRPSLRLPADMQIPTEEPSSTFEDPSTAPPTEKPSSEASEGSSGPSVDGEHSPPSEDLRSASESPPEDNTSPESEQMMPAPNTIGVTSEPPEEGSGFSK